MSKSINQMAAALCLLGLSAMTACSKRYDDGPLRERVDKVETIVSSVEARATALGKELEAIKQIVDAVKNRNEITEVKEQRDASGQLTGYTISFAKGSDVTIRMGTPGNDAIPPKISILKHSDGHYYWQVGGKPLLDASGRMYRADGDNGKTPRLRIEGDEWQASYDEGRSWLSLGRAKGAQGASAGSEGLLASIDHSSDPAHVIFKFLAGGEDLRVPRREELQIRFDVPEGLIKSVKFERRDTAEIPFTITGSLEGLSLYTIGEVLMEYREGERSGKLLVKQAGTVSIVAVRAGKKYIFSCHIESGHVRVLDPGRQNYFYFTKTVNINGFEDSHFDIPVETNVDYKVEIAEEDKSWLSVADTRAALRNETLRFTAKANTHPSDREATVRLVDALGNDHEQIIIIQTAAEDKESTATVTLSGIGETFSAAYSAARPQIPGSESVIHRLKVKGTPSEADWKMMHRQLKICRILDLSEANITVIPEGTFANDPYSLDPSVGIEYIIFPQSLQRIGRLAFRHQLRLRQVRLPEGVVIENFAFDNTPYKYNQR